MHSTGWPLLSLYPILIYTTLLFFNSHCYHFYHKTTMIITVRKLFVAAVAGSIKTAYSYIQSRAAVNNNLNLNILRVHSMWLDFMTCRWLIYLQQCLKRAYNFIISYSLRESKTGKTDTCVSERSEGLMQVVQRGLDSMKYAVKWIKSLHYIYVKQNIERIVCWFTPFYPNVSHIKW